MNHKDYSRPQVSDGEASPDMSGKLPIFLRDLKRWREKAPKKRIVKFKNQNYEQIDYHGYNYGIVGLHQNDGTRFSGKSRIFFEVYF
jgi:hypothetical protein